MKKAGVDWVEIARYSGVSRSHFSIFFFTLVTVPRSLSLKVSDTRVYQPPIRARLETTAHLCKVVVLKLRQTPSCAQMRRLALSQSIWAHMFGAPGLFSAPELTDVHRTPSMST